MLFEILNTRLYFKVKYDCYSLLVYWNLLSFYAYFSY